jgi:glycosyltransferase involved in cell wall biosynthesis
MNFLRFNGMIITTNWANKARFLRELNTMKQKSLENLLTIVVPVYNEAEILPAIAPEIVAYCQARGWQIVFVNDGSSDSTRQILEDYCGAQNVRVIHHKVNRGYGGALKTGIRQAMTDYVVTIDGDGQHHLEDIEKVFQFALENDADMVVGKRDLPSSFMRYRFLGKKIIRAFTRILMPLPISDLNSGFKLYRTDLAKKYSTVCPDTMAFSDVITLVFLNEHNLVLEHPIQVSPRKVGQSTITTFTAFETVIEVLNISVMFNPLRVFLPLSFICILAGFGWGIPIILLGRGVSVGAMLAIVTGLLFFIIGLIASQLSAIRMERLRRIAGSHDVDCH